MTEVGAEHARLYHLVMTGFVEAGRAPHYTQLAKRMGIEPEVARRLLHEVTSLRLPNWLYPGTDLIASFAPFSDLTGNYRVTVDGEQRWFAQCGLESLAVSHLFPGRLVEVESACLDCGEPVRLRMRDGALLQLDPPTAVGHSNLPLARWYPQIDRA